MRALLQTCSGIKELFDEPKLERIGCNSETHWIRALGMGDIQGWHVLFRLCI